MLLRAKKSKSIIIATTIKERSKEIIPKMKQRRVRARSSKAFVTLKKFTKK